MDKYLHNHWILYSVSGEKKEQNVFHNIYKLKWFWQNLLHSFLKKIGHKIM